MLKPRQSSSPRSKRGPARESRYQGSFIRCRKKSCSCVSHTSLFCGVQAPAFFRFRAPRSKHASALARMTAPRALCYTTMRTCFSATCEIVATSALLNLERLAARGRRGTRLSAGEICTSIKYLTRFGDHVKVAWEKEGPSSALGSLDQKTFCDFHLSRHTHQLARAKSYRHRIHLSSTLIRPPNNPSKPVRGHLVHLFQLPPLFDY